MPELPATPTILRTNVGSHMWGMQHKLSDIDMFGLWQVPTRDILRAKHIKANSFHQDREKNLDLSLHEIGPAIHQLISGNVNFVWGFTSPIIIETSDEGNFIRELAMRSLSKRSFHSINGLVNKNLKKYIDNPSSKLDDRVIQKKLNIMARTLRFGICLLEGDGLQYVAMHAVPVSEIRRLQVCLQEAYDNSPLPEECPNQEELIDWVERMRIDSLVQETEVITWVK